MEGVPPVVVEDMIGRWGSLAEGGFLQSIRGVVYIVGLGTPSKYSIVPKEWGGNTAERGCGVVPPEIEQGATKRQLATRRANTRYAHVADCDAVNKRLG